MLAISAVVLAAMLWPLYWFWDRIATSPAYLVLVLGALAVCLFNGAKYVLILTKTLRSLPEQ